ncbi:hypothetical protein HDU86_001666 [Geranomyces michiganensis]|nr:hypothetical protein HDU86_001666 [Geranomyces michiganensis]
MVEVSTRPGDMLFNINADRIDPRMVDRLAHKRPDRAMKWFLATYEVKWDNSRTKAFNASKTALLTAPSLAAPRKGFPISLHLDASYIAFNVTLFQL